MWFLSTFSVYTQRGTIWSRGPFLFSYVCAREDHVTKSKYRITIKNITITQSKYSSTIYSIIITRSTVTISGPGSRPLHYVMPLKSVSTRTQEDINATSTKPNYYTTINSSTKQSNQCYLLFYSSVHPVVIISTYCLMYLLLTFSLLQYKKKIQINQK